VIDGTTVLEQRCLVHTRPHVVTTCRNERKGNENRGLRKPMMEQAAAVSQADTVSEARLRLAHYDEQ
jgi:hypothetical protein